MKKRLLYLLLILYLPLTAQEDNNKDRVNNLIMFGINKATNGSTLEDINELFYKIDESYPNNSEVLLAWGTSIMISAKKNYSLYESAFDKFQKVAELEADNARAYFLWAIGKSSYAQEKKDKTLFSECFLLFQKAIEVDPLFSNAYFTWGVTLFDCARQNNDIELYKESIDKLQKALSIDTEKDETLEYIGIAFLRIGKLEKDLFKYKDQTVEVLSQSDKRGGVTAAYNLACYYSLIKDKESALKWFERMLIKRSSSEGSELKRKIETDKDFDNIRKDKKFKELMDRYF